MEIPRPRTILTLLAALLIGPMLLACSDESAPTAIDAPPSFEVTENDGWVNLNFTQFDDCTGEFVDFVTRQKFVRTAVDDGAGGEHWGIHRTWIGEGVGRSSGTAYQLSWPVETQFHVGVNALYPLTFSRREQLNLVSQGPADNRLLHSIQVITIDANRELRVNFKFETLACTG